MESVEVEGKRIKIKMHNKTTHFESLRKLFGIDKPDPGGLAERVTLVIVRPTEPTPKALGLWGAGLSDALSRWDPGRGLGKS